MIRRFVTPLVVLTVVLIGGVLVFGTGLDVMRSRAVAAVYRQRLVDLSDQHVALADRYNDAVRRTAVTELVVRPAGDPRAAIASPAGEPGGDGSDGGGEGGADDGDAEGSDAGAGAGADAAPAIPTDRPTLSVRVRSVEGTEREIMTPFDPRDEIYVDFVVIDGRVLIRRIFDERTPPADGLLIDAGLGSVDWTSERANLGKAVYRSLRPGRWTVSVAGAGTIDLRWSGEPDDPPVALEASVAVEDFDEIEAEAGAAEQAITWRDLWRWVRGDEASASPAP